MKLNNNGWGMIMFIIIICLLFLLILLISILANNFDDNLPSSRRIETSFIENKNLENQI